MEGFVQRWGFLLLCSVKLAGNIVRALPYDYSASIECLAEPQKPQYVGGIIRNPEFDNGLQGWHTFSGGKLEARISKRGNRFLVSHSRSLPHHSLSQKLYLQQEMLYTLSAWVQINEGDSLVSAIFKTVSGYIHAGTVEARVGCWSMLKGGLTVNASGAAELYFETKNTALEIWIDSVSLQPFTEIQWRAHQEDSIQKVRMRRVRIHAVDSQGNTLPGATISIKQTKSRFPLGCAINQNILYNPAYQNWFTSRFTHTTFENEMKWYSTGKNQGQEDYSVPDAMLAFARQHGIAVRGHNIFWDDPTYQQGWVKSLSSDQLRAAADKRISSIVSRYRGQVIAWDVVNENLHFSFYESKLGSGASNGFYLRAHRLDPQSLKFMNDYNTLEEPADPMTTPLRYLRKLYEIGGVLGRSGKMAIGLEGHFHTPNIPYVRSALDSLAKAKVPIWITELDVSQGPNQTNYLNAIMREAYSHPAVQGVIIWSAWRPEGCYRMCLTDNNFKNLPTGDVVDGMLSELKKFSEAVGVADSNGFFEAQLIHGDYDVKINHQSVNFSSVQSFVGMGASSHVETALHVTVSV